MDDIIRPGRRPAAAAPSAPPPPAQSAPNSDSARRHVDIAGVQPRRVSVPTAQPPAPAAVDNIDIGHPALDTTGLPVAIAQERPAPSAPSSQTSSKPSSMPELESSIPTASTPSSFLPPSDGRSSDEAPALAAGTAGVVDQASSEPSLLDEVEAHEKSRTSARVEQAPTTPIKKKHNLSAVIVAILLALGLVAGAGYAYWQNNKTTTTTLPSSSPNTSTPKSSPATTEDIDATVKAIDQSMKTIDDAKDFQATDLSDSTLGL